MSTTTRNVLIIVALAAAVYALPGGGQSADFVQAILGLLFTATFGFIGWRLYRERRSDLFGLGEQHRTLLYGALGGLVLALALRVRLFETGAGTLLWFALVAGVVYAFYLVFVHYRSYDY